MKEYLFVIANFNNGLNIKLINCNTISIPGIIETNDNYFITMIRNKALFHILHIKEKTYDFYPGTRLRFDVYDIRNRYEIDTAPIMSGSYDKLSEHLNTHIYGVCNTLTIHKFITNTINADLLADKTLRERNRDSSLKNNNLW